MADIHFRGDGAPRPWVASKSASRAARFQNRFPFISIGSFSKIGITWCGWCRSRPVGMAGMDTMRERSRMKSLRAAMERAARREQTYPLQVAGCSSLIYASADGSDLFKGDGIKERASARPAPVPRAASGEFSSILRMMNRSHNEEAQRRQYVPLGFILIQL